MKLRFVSHASFSLETNGTTLLTDPWLFGKAFNNGWALLSPAAEVNWPKIDYLWISHQHPDHLHFPTLKSIPSEQRERMVLLYQKHASPQIASVLEGLGFANVTEITLHRWMPLRNGLEVLCGSAGSMDSWLAIRCEGNTLLNLNDCIMNRAHLATVKRLVGKVDVLLTQFSFANWIGNHADDLGEAERKISDLRYRVNFLRPQFTIPFASFIYFCNHENAWMNDFAVTPKRVANMGLPGINFMYPGDEWDASSRQFRNAEAVDKYMADLEHQKEIDPTPPPVAEEKVAEAANRMMRRLRSRFGSRLIDRIPTFSMYLHDLDRILLVDPRAECKILLADAQARAAARYVVCSQVVWYAFAYSWGWATMEVSGMYLDREFEVRNPIAFYLNVLATEFCDLRGVRQSLRTLNFLWSKRTEISSRAWGRLFGKTDPDDDIAGQREISPARKAA